MRIIKSFVMAAVSLLALESLISAEMTGMSLQERRSQSDAVVVGEIIESRNTGKETEMGTEHWLATCRVERYIIGPKIHNPNVEEAKAASLIRIAFEHRLQKPMLVKLVAGKKYLLFLKETASGYEMITPYHGAFEAGQDYFVHDEQSSEYPKAVQMSFDAIVSRLTNELALFIKPDKQIYAVGEEIGFTLDFKNVSAGNLQLFTKMLPLLDLHLGLYKLDGDKKQNVSPPELIGMLRQIVSDSDFMEFLPGGSFSKHLTFKEFANGLTLAQGNYELFLEVKLSPSDFAHVSPTPWTGRVESNTVRFEIKGEKLSVKGSLTFPDGTKPLAATITVGNESSYYQATSDKEGNYMFYDILPGRYNLLASGVTGNKAAGMFIKKDIQIEAEGPALEIPVILGPPQQ